MSGLGLVVAASESEEDKNARCWGDQTLVTANNRQPPFPYGRLLALAVPRATPIHVLLNKKDLFEEMIREVPLTACFPEYSGPPGEVTPAIRFIEGAKRCFLAVVRARPGAVKRSVAWRGVAWCGVYTFDARMQVMTEKENVYAPSLTGQDSAAAARFCCLQNTGISACTHHKRTRRNPCKICTILCAPLCTPGLLPGGVPRRPAQLFERKQTLLRNRGMNKEE